MSEHEILTLEEVAEWLRVSERAVHAWATKGEIPCGKLGTTWRFKRSEVEKWVNARLTRPTRHAPEEPLRLRDVLDAGCVLRLSCASKEAALNTLVDCLAESPEVGDGEELRREIFAREALMSTGIGCGVGVPHVRLASVKDVVLAFAVNDQALRDYVSLDGYPVRIVCMLAAHADQHAQYLQVLSAISGLLQDAVTREALFTAADEAAVYRILTRPE